LVHQIAALDEKQDEYDVNLEMHEADIDADAIIEREEQDDEEERALMGIDSDIRQGAGPAKKKNKDSSDDECACAPP
jgi:hypothetical protein